MLNTTSVIFHIPSARVGGKSISESSGGGMAKTEPEVVGKKHREKAASMTMTTTTHYGYDAGDDDDDDDEWKRVIGGHLADC